MNKTNIFLISVTAFFLSLIAMTPASLVYTALQDEFFDALPDLSVKIVEGSIWNGSSELKFRNFPATNAIWQLSPLHLLIMSANSSVTISALGLYGKFAMTISPKGTSIKNLNAIIEDRYLNDITIPLGLDLSGEINLVEIHLEFDKQWITEASGELTWDGGIVHIQTPEKIHTVTLPPLQGHLSLVGNICELDIKESDETMMQIQIKPDGWVKVAINYAFIDLTNIPLPTIASVDGDPALILEEKIL